MKQLTLTTPFSVRFPALLDDLLNLENFETQGNGLSISEDDKSVYVEAAMPGIDPAKAEVTVENGILHISGQGEEEMKERKYYRKTSHNFSYEVILPADIDESTEPVAEEKHGVLRVTFMKLPKAQPKKISIKDGK